MTKERRRLPGRAAALAWPVPEIPVQPVRIPVLLHDQNRVVLEGMRQHLHRVVQLIGHGDAQDWRHRRTALAGLAIVEAVLQNPRTLVVDPRDPVLKDAILALDGLCAGVIEQLEEAKRQAAERQRWLDEVGYVPGQWLQPGRGCRW